MRDMITVPAIMARKGGTRLIMVTAYDAPTARILDKAGVDMILVGDSVATTVLGYEDRLPITIDIIVHHTAAVTRAQPRALVIADMPWLSYHISPEETIRNAGCLIREGHARAVKLEGGRERIPMIKALLDAKIPVMGHLELTPQLGYTMRNEKAQECSKEIFDNFIEDAKALARAGVFALVLKCVPHTLAKQVTEEIAIPTVGIGAGPHCDGQVQIFHDMLGMSYGHPAKFVRQYAQISELATQAVRAYSEDVRLGNYPADEENP